MRPGPSPLVGYNTNVRHKGKLYHIQTEDSGINHPHVITHLFADGGRIIASRKTSYSEHLGSKDLQSLVKKLMQDQHKAMFIELRDCVYDEDGTQAQGQTSATATPRGHGASAAQASAPGAQNAQNASPSMRPSGSGLEDIDIDALERAAEARIAESVTARVRADAPRRGVGRYQQTVAAQPPRARAQPPSAPSRSIFGGEVLRGKSLDEVILSYLADDTGERER